MITEKTLAEIVTKSEDMAIKFVDDNFKGQVTEESCLMLLETAIEVAFFACHMSHKYFKKDQATLNQYITDGITLRFEQGAKNEQD